MGPSTQSTFHSVFSRALLAAGLMVGLAACTTSGSVNPTPNPTENTDIKNASAPENFAYATTRTVSLNISSEDLFADPVANSVVRISHSYDLAQNDTGQEILVALTNEQGKFSSEVSVPSHIESLLITLDAVGIPNTAEVAVASSVAVHFGPSQEDRSEVDTSSLTPQGLLSTQLYSYKTLGSWSSKGGLPKYLMEPYPIAPSKRTLGLIKTSFPENKSVTEHHPSFLVNDAETDLIFTDSAEVIVTFLHEGAGYKNTFAYYTYDPKNPPSSVDDIDNLTIIFPNSSYYKSGGSLLSGDRVKLKYGVGTSNVSTKFPAGTALGWAVVADGWKVAKNNKGSLSDGNAIYYSEKTLNADKAQHVVLLYDDVDKVLLLGAEDLNRNEKDTDHDFNDIVFKVTVSDPNAIELANIVKVDDGKDPDADKDGVTDSYDHYPSDPSKAFNTYHPSKAGVNTLAFEDRWPLEGDYDFNDLVVDYRVNQVMNAKNQVVELDAEFTFRAAGAAFTNAFAFELPIPASSVASVTGAHFVDPNGSFNYIKRNANGTEAGQDKAVIFVSDDVGALLGYLVNTNESDAKAEAKTVKLTVTFTEPQNKADFVPPYNPFIVTNLDSLSVSATGEERAGNRGREVHLANHAPTQLADMSLFGTLDDQSISEDGQWYVTQGNKLPWALHIPESFDYLIEKEEVSAGYTHFVDWVNSGGGSYADWYKNKEGYRDNTKIY